MPSPRYLKLMMPPSNLPDDFHVSMDQLRVGLYVHLDLRWFDHPFAFNQFLIKSEEQILALRKLGLRQVRYDPARSEVRPLVSAGEEAEIPPPVAPSDTVPATALQAKRSMIERIRQQRENSESIAAAFIDTARTLREIEKNLFSRPEESQRQATELVAHMADSFLNASELALQVMGEKSGNEEIYFHSLNVTMLSLMMARSIKLPQELLGSLGLGALFHDIGCREIPGAILNKTEPLNRAERNFYELHCQYGVDIGQRLQLNSTALAIIREHHELFDGSGYPGKLQGESIGLLPRIVAIANYYDELCNPVNIADALTPHEALSVMFARLRGKFDPKLLQVFIRCLGVYPPGTIVQLSNGVIGMVATVNTAKPLKPMVVIHDPNIPRDEAILVDMERETDVNIAKAIRPAQLRPDIYAYLSPRRRVSYYFDAGSPGLENKAP